MKSITKASRINAANQVIQHMNSGMTVVEACREVGMARSSFYYIVENNPQAIADIQAIIDTNVREQLVLILQHRMEIFEKIIQDGLSEKHHRELG
jgi:ACT domain-containing protein